MTATPAPEGGFPSLTLRLTQVYGKDRAAIEEALSKVNELLFMRLGVIAPRIAVRTVRGIRRSAVLDLDGRVLGKIDPGNSAQSVVALLAKYAELLIVPGLVEFYLGKLKARAPALVSAVRARFSIPVLVDALRAIVRGDRSIRDLAGVLNEILSEAVLAPTMIRMPAAESMPKYEGIPSGR
jgi:type III secretory pathway component EscV